MAVLEPDVSVSVWRVDEEVIAVWMPEKDPANYPLCKRLFPLMLRRQGTLLGFAVAPVAAAPIGEFLDGVLDRRDGVLIEALLQFRRD